LQNFLALQNQGLNAGSQFAGMVGAYAPLQQQQGQLAATGGDQYAQNIGQYSPMLQQQGANAAGGAGQYAQQIGQYSNPMMSMGQNALNAGNQYAQQIGGYANPMMGLAGQAGANNNMGLNSLMGTAAGGGPGMEQLAAASRGDYLNSNPYLAEAIRAAQDPTQRAYQTSIAPTTDAMFSGGGRYGSGAMAGAVNTGQQNLVRGLGDISTNMSNANYARERQLQDAAAQAYAQQQTGAGQAYGTLYNSGLGLGMQGVQNAANIQQGAANTMFNAAQAGQQGATNAANAQQQAGNLFLSGQTQAAAGLRDAMAAQQAAGSQYLSSQDRAAAGLRDAASTQAAAGNQYWQGQNAAQSAAQQYAANNLAGISGLNNQYNTGNQAAMNALQMYPQFAQSQFIGPQGQVQAGTGMSSVEQAQINDQMARYYGQQNAPWDLLGKYMGSIGQPTTGSSTSQQPYFQNQFADALSGISGAAGIGRNLGLWGGSGGAASAAGGLGGLGGLAGAGGGIGSALSAAAPWATTAAAGAAPLEMALLGGGGAAGATGLGSFLGSLGSAAMAFI
jgi:hypothetical protein